ncbi:MAG: 1-deoxy-D-xylulose-5-phosphate synthase [bacterium]|nr:1-deoxy-D-xylulose-5-phosphate synthase [bacterium]
MYLEKIKTLKDLKKLDIKTLPLLVSEVRKLIIETVSQTGGHLASNLGVVELTIALHYVFNCPDDKIVWDVGHQAYTHKILTGRRNQFHTLRQFGGMSGFTKIEESEYDVFGTGHGSTSISAALGMACAQKLTSNNNKLIAVIGDGALTGGMAFEALNHAGHIKKNIIVILNSNEMSISRNVGAWSQYLNRITTNPIYNRVRDDLELVLKRVPKFGNLLVDSAKKLEKSLKLLLTPGILFDELGFRYIGPIDGHNIPLLIETLDNIKIFKGPVLVHILTKKGKGYKFAEENPTRFHSAKPFDIETGIWKSKDTDRKRKTYTELFGSALIKLAQKDKRIVAITAAMPDGTGLREFAQKFPDRFFDVGMAEQHAVTFAAGLALKGLKPVVAIYSTFLQRAYDQVLHDICLQKIPVIFAIDRAGIVVGDGPTHQGVFDLSYLSMIPNMTIMAPKNGDEFVSMLSKAVEYGQPVSIRYPKDYAAKSSSKEPSSNSIQKIEIGKGEILRDGNDIALLAIGTMVYPALEAAEILEKKNINVSVANMRFVKPLDTELIEKIASQIKKIVTVEENVIAGGFGMSVAAYVETQDVASLHIGLPDKFIEQGPRHLLLKKYKLDGSGIADTILNWI